MNGDSMGRGSANARRLLYGLAVVVAVLVATLMWVLWPETPSDDSPVAQTPAGQQSDAAKPPPADPSLEVTGPGGYKITGKKWLPDCVIPVPAFSHRKDKELAPLDIMLDEDQRVILAEWGNPAGRLSLDRGSLEELVREFTGDANARILGPTSLELTDPSLAFSIRPFKHMRRAVVTDPKNADNQRSTGEWGQFMFFRIETTAQDRAVIVMMNSQGVIGDIYRTVDNGFNPPHPWNFTDRNFFGAAGGVTVRYVCDNGEETLDAPSLSLGMSLPYLHGCPWMKEDLDHIMGHAPLDRFWFPTEFKRNDTRAMSFLERNGEILRYPDAAEEERKRFERFRLLNLKPGEELPVQGPGDFKEAWDRRWLNDLPRPSWALKK